MESPVAQWLEHSTRSWTVMGSNPIWSSDFFQVSHDAKTYHDVNYYFACIYIDVVFLNFFFYQFTGSNAEPL